MPNTVDLDVDALLLAIQTAQKGIRKQATRMIARSNMSLRSERFRDIVTVLVSQFDRSTTDPPNVIGVVVNRDNAMHITGTHK